MVLLFLGNDAGRGRGRVASAGRGLGWRAKPAEPAVSRGKRGSFGATARFPVVRIHGEYAEVHLQLVLVFFSAFFYSF